MLRLSLGQIDLVLGDAEENLRRIALLTEEAAARGSQLVVFPELWSTAYDLENWQRHADMLGRGMFARLGALARRHRVAIASSILEKRDQRAYNTLAVYSASGELLAIYRKVHLVPMLDEPRWLSPGEGLQRVEAPWGPSGLGICYDLRFPEMWRRYALEGAKLMIIPAEWPSSRVEHWRVLLRARAIENQVFVAACNRVGSSRGEMFAGYSSVIDPWGNTVIEGSPTSEELLTVDIDLDTVESVRSRVPVFASRRPDVY